MDKATFDKMFYDSPAARRDVKFHTILNAMEKFRVSDKTETCALFAHIAIESDRLKTNREYASGAEYEGRYDLGNIYPGDGVLFAGGGDIQLTGRDVYRKFRDYCRSLGINCPDFEARPEKVRTDEWASFASLYFWCVYKPWLGPCARLGWFHVTQKLVNGGENGWPERLEHYQRNLALMGLPAYGGPDYEKSQIAYWQAQRGLLADGLVGQKTFAAVLKG
jgi:putative chitinase